MSTDVFLYGDVMFFRRKAIGAQEARGQPRGRQGVSWHGLPLSLTSAVLLGFNTRPLEAPTTSPGQAFRPEPCFDGRGARCGPAEAENCQKPPSCFFARRRRSWGRSPKRVSKGAQAVERAHRRSQPQGVLSEAPILQAIGALCSRPEYSRDGGPARGAPGSAEQTTSPHLTSNRLQSNRLHSNRLQSNRLQSNRLQSNRLQSNRLHSNRLQSNRLHSNRLQSNRLQSTRLQSNRLQSNRLQSNRLQSNRLQSSGLAMQSIAID